MMASGLSLDLEEEEAAPDDVEGPGDCPGNRMAPKSEGGKQFEALKKISHTILKLEISRKYPW